MVQQKYNWQGLLWPFYANLSTEIRYCIRQNNSTDASFLKKWFICKENAYIIQRVANKQRKTDITIRRLLSTNIIEIACNKLITLLYFNLLFQQNEMARIVNLLNETQKSFRLIASHYSNTNYIQIILKRRKVHETFFF